MRAPVAVDLFAGAGGLAEGLESAGVQVPVAIELHPQAALTHAFNHSNTTALVGDIRELRIDTLADTVRRRIGSDHVDLVVGGPPCQGFSTAGKKLSEDPRNNLFQQFARVVEHFRPQMFLLENVPGFKKMHRGRAFEEASLYFSRLGYTLTSTILDASHYGVPQRRQRFVMVGWLANKVDSFSWPMPTHEEAGIQAKLPFDTITKSPFVTVYEALEDIAFLEPGWESHTHQLELSSEYQRERRNGLNLLFNHLASYHRPKAIEMFSHIAEGATISDVPTHLRSAKRTMARLNRAAISNAVLALPDDLIHYRHNRIPTVREMARLQSFDDDFVFFGKRTSGFVERRVDVPQYTQVGNAVPPLLGQALGVALVKSLGGCIHDGRDLVQRRSRHCWVQGSSGYAGYTLSPEAEGLIAVEDFAGQRLPLPTSSSDCPISRAVSLQEWKSMPNPKRGQWSPTIHPKPVPAYVLDPM